MSSSAPSQQDLKQQGNVHFQNDEFEKAIDFYTQAINLDPAGDPTVPILSNRSLCYYNIKKYKEAYEDAGCCCGLKPDWAKGFARRGFAAEKLGEWQIALESFDEYLKLNNDNDEMDVRKDRNFMNKLIIGKRKQQEETLRSLQKIEKDLQNIPDPDERHAEACALFYGGHEDFPKSRDRMRVAAKYCRLDTPVNFGGRDDVEQHTLLSGFSKRGIQACWAEIRDEGRLFVIDSHIGTRYSTLIHQTLRKIVENIDRSSTDTCFDFFCDLVEDAEEDYSPLAAEGDNDSKFEMKKREILMARDCVPFYYCVELNDHYSGAVTETGKVLDLTLTLLNRGKPLFFGKKTQMTDKEYATRLFREFVCQVISATRRFSSAGCRDVVDACRALLDAKANVNGIIPNSGLSQTSVLFHAIRSEALAPTLVQLFFQHGADLNFGPQGQNKARAPLDVALYYNQLEIAELTFTRGGRLGSVETPMWIQELVKEGHLPDPSLIKPRSMVFHRQISEETVRLLFDLMERQDLSFYGRSFDLKPREAEEQFTPLTLVISSPLYHPEMYLFSAALVDLIVKLKPSLVFAPFFSRRDKKVTTIDVLAYLAEKTSVKSRKDDIVYFKEVAKSLIVRGGFDFETAYREHEMKTGKSNYPFVDMQELTEREKKLQEYLWQLVEEREEVKMRNK